MLERRGSWEIKINSLCCSSSFDIVGNGLGGFFASSKLDLQVLGVGEDVATLLEVDSGDAVSSPCEWTKS